MREREGIEGTVAGSFENRRCAVPVLLCFPFRCRLAAIPPFSQKKRTYRQQV